MASFFGASPIKKIAAVLLCFFPATVAAQSSTVFNGPVNDGEFEVPPYITEITVETWGGGGRGGDTSGNNSQAGGGGGGAYARSTLTVEPEETFDITVGGTSGGDTTFGSGASLVEAEGGGNVADNDSTGGQGGQVANSTGDVVRAGTDGTAGTSSGNPKSGGDGGDAPGGLSTSGGAGGSGGTGGNAGQDGGAPGGGGGGSATTTGGGGGNKSQQGGSGGAGRIRITYQQPVLRFEQQPTNAAVDETIDPPITVRAEDSDGNLVTEFDGEVTLTIDNNPGSRSLNGTTTVDADDGVAKLSDLSIDAAGTGYTLEATADDTEPVVSAGFDILSDAVAISGEIEELRGSGGDVTITLNDGQEVTTNDEGAYSVTVASDSTVSLTPEQDGLVFCPSSRSVTVADQDRPGQSFKAFPNEDPGSAGTGGDAVYTDPDTGDIVHVYCSTGDSQFTPPDLVDEVEVLVVGGGGGGGAPLHFSSAGGGGGGAGGLIFDGAFAVDGAVDVSVGAGGSRGDTSDQPSPGGNGGDSVFDTLEAIGGGGGSGNNCDEPEVGRDGGSGGGSRGDCRAEGLQPDSTSGGFGSDGGAHPNSGLDPQLDRAAGGGGGAEERGEDLDDDPGEDGGAGGAGRQYAITGVDRMYAGGGGGGAADNRGNDPGDPGAGGEGGGGAGGRTGLPATPGFPASGGGGGGGNNSVPGAQGGSGIVVVRYTPPQPSVEPQLEYRMDEVAWDGQTGEVKDSSGNGENGTARGGADTAFSNPALGDNTFGTCRYGTFDAADDLRDGAYVESPELSDILNDTATVAFWIRTTQTSPNPEAWQSPGIAGVEELGGTDDIFWGWLDDTGRIGISVANDFDEEQKSTNPINDGQWRHVALTRDAESGETQIFINGELDNTGTTGIGEIENSYSSIGRIENTDGGTDPYYFEGELDEFRVYDQVLDEQEIQRIANVERECGDVAVDIADYVVTAPGQGLTCVSNTIEIEARDADGNAVSPDSGTVLSLSSDQRKGTWSRVITGSGTLQDTTTGDGAGSYEFPGGESGVDLAFDYPAIDTDPEAVTVTADDGSASGTSDPLAVSLAGFRFLDDDTDTGADIISGQIAGKPSETGFGASTIGLQAIRASEEDPRTCQGVFDDGDTVSVDLGAECRNPANCAGNTVDAAGTPIATSDDNGDSAAPAAFDAVDLTFGANSTAELPIGYADAGLMRLYARYEIEFDDEEGTPSGEFLRGASNEFAVRPFGFYVDFDPDGTGTFDDRAAGSCDDQTSCATGPDGAGNDVFATAGETFATQVEAVTWTSEDDGDTDGVPDTNQGLADNAATPNFGQESDPETVDLTRTLVAPSGGREGTLTGGGEIGGFADGATTADLSWNEVGIIDLDAALSSGDYLGAGNVNGEASNVGRFIPDYLVQTVAQDGMFDTACGNEFTYIGQTFGYEVQPEILIEAFNAQNSSTRNYQDDYARLDESGIGRSAPDEDDSQNGRDGTLLPVEANTEDGDLESDGNGTLTYTFSMTDSFDYTRNNNARVAPFEPNMTITIDSVEDKDGVTADAADRADVTPMSPGVPASGIPPIRFGRLSIDSAVGSELKELPLPLEAQYWDGSTWIVNEDDECSTLNLATDVDLEDQDGTLFDGDEEDVPLGGGTTTLTDFTADSLTLGDGDADAGTADLVFTEPGAGNVGWVDVVIDLDAAGLPFLRDDLDDDDVFEENPEARASFGLFPGSANQIYREEVLR